MVFSLVVTLLLAVLCAAAPLGQAADPLAPLEQLASSAEAILQRGDLAAAEKRYREALFEGWMILGTLRRLDQRAAEARDAFEQAARLVPGHRAALHSLAGAQIQSGAARAAVDVLAPLAAGDAKDVDTRLLLAKALAASGEGGRAARTLDEAAAAADGDPEATFRVATEYAWLKKPDAAERLFARLLAARPLPETHVLIGRTWRDAGDYDRARAHLAAALKQDPQVRRAHYYLGMVALADARGGAERVERAIAEFRAELALDPGDALAGDQLGSALLEAGRPAEARPVLEAAVAADPRPLYLLHLGRALMAVEQPAAAADALRRALETPDALGAADLESVHYQLGLALRRLGRAEEAARHLAEARQRAAARAETPEAMAAPLVEISPLAELTVAARRAAEERVKPILARAGMNVGVMRAQARDFTAATELLEKAASLEPDLPRLHYTLGVAAFNAGQFDKAVDALTRALRGGSEVAEANAALGMAYLELGRLPEAEAALRAALEARPDAGPTRDNLARVLERVQERRRKEER